MHLVHETIYRDLYDYRGGGLTRAYCAKLRTGRNRRKPSRKMPKRRSRFAGDVLMIADRPFEPSDRTGTGNWEGDLIMGRHNRSAIGTLIDRRSRQLLLIHIDNADRAGSLCRGLTTAFLVLPEHQRRTLTWDQGSEMSRHAEVTKATGVDIYFCDPHSPWQRGSNENANGLLHC
jgi:IS30 family transposase